MRQHRFILVVFALIGVGAFLANYTTAGGPAEPTKPPEAATGAAQGRLPVSLAGPDGETLRCAGKIVTVSPESLGIGQPPPLTGAQVRDLTRKGKLTDEPSILGFTCAKNARGRETGDAVARQVEPDGRLTTRSLPNVTQG